MPTLCLRSVALSVALLSIDASAGEPERASPKPSADELFAEGLKAWQKGQFPQAQEKFKQAAYEVSRLGRPKDRTNKIGDYLDKLSQAAREQLDGETRDLTKKLEDQAKQSKDEKDELQKKIDLLQHLKVSPDATGFDKGNLQKYVEIDGKPPSTDSPVINVGEGHQIKIRPPGHDIFEGRVGLAPDGMPNLSVTLPLRHGSGPPPWAKLGAFGVAVGAGAAGGIFGTMASNDAAQYRNGVNPPDRYFYASRNEQAAATVLLVTSGVSLILGGALWFVEGKL